MLPRSCCRAGVRTAALWALLASAAWQAGNTRACELQRRIDAQAAAKGRGEAVAVADTSRELAACLLRLLGDSRAAEAAGTKTEILPALELYRESLRLQEDPDTRLALAVGLLLAEQTDEALELARQAAEARPESARGWQALAELQLQAGRSEQALESVRRSLGARPEAASALALGQRLLQREEPDWASKVFDHLLESEVNRAETLRGIARVQTDAGFYTAAIRRLEEALALGADPHLGQLQLGYAYWLLNERHNSPEAEAAMRRAVATGPESYDAHFYLAQLLSIDRRYDEAAELFQAAARLSPRAAEPWLHLGLDAFATGDSAAAQSHLYKGLELRSARPPDDLVRRAHAVLSRIATAGGRVAEGEALFRRARAIRRQLEAEPAPVSWSAEQLESHHQRRMELAETLAGTFNDWGTAEANRQRFPEAVQRYQQAERWFAAAPGLMRNLGLSAFQAGDYGESSRALAQALESEPDNLELRTFLALSLASSNRFAEAAEAFARVGDGLFENPRLAYLWAVSLARSQQPAEARRVLTRLQSLGLPTAAILQVASLYEELGDPRSALEALETAAEKDPGHPGLEAALVAIRQQLGR